MTKFIDFKDEQVQFPYRYELTDNGNGTYNIIPSPGTIAQEGTLATSELMNSMQLNGIFKVDAGGTNNSIVTSIEGLGAYESDLKVLLKATYNNTDTVDININSLGAKVVKKLENNVKVDLVEKDITEGGIFLLVYDGVDFVLVNPSLEAQMADLTEVNENILFLQTRGVRYLG